MPISATLPLRIAKLVASASGHGPSRRWHSVLSSQVA